MRMHWWAVGLIAALAAGCSSTTTSDIGGARTTELNDDQITLLMVGMAEATSNPRLDVFAYKARVIQGVTFACGWLRGKKSSGGSLGSKPWRGHFSDAGFVLTEVALEREQFPPILAKCQDLGLRLL